MNGMERIIIEIIDMRAADIYAVAASPSPQLNFEKRSPNRVIETARPVLYVQLARLRNTYA